jgi:hypothetical protein
MDTLYLVFKDRFQIVFFGLPYRRPKLASSKRGLYPMPQAVSSALGIFLELSFHGNGNHKNLGEPCVKTPLANRWKAFKDACQNNPKNSA